MNSKTSFRLATLVLAIISNCVSVSTSADVVIKNGNPADYARFPDSTILEQWLQLNQALAAQGQLTPSAILAANTHNVTVGSVPSIIPSGVPAPTVIPQSGLTSSALQANQAARGEGAIVTEVFGTWTPAT